MYSSTQTDVALHIVTSSWQLHCDGETPL